MNSAHISLDPAFPICWENLDTLRVGFDRAAVRLPAPSPAAQRFLAALRTGVEQEELTSLAKRAGLSAREQRVLMRRLDPVLVRGSAHATSPDLTTLPAMTLAVFGRGVFAHGIRERLALAEYPLVSAGERPGFAVLVEEFLHGTALAQSLLADGVPHIPIRVTDQHLFLGPAVLPGGAPCLSCVELHQLDVEPALHVLGAQLANETPAAATAACTELASASVLAMLRRWQHGSTELARIRLSYPVVRGLPSPIPAVERIPPHTSCGCGALSPAR